MAQNSDHSGSTRPDPLLVVTGPTASGKGAVAFELARRTGGEIVSLDSMKVYRGLDVGTAKPAAERRRTVRYHLLDVVPPEREFSTGDFLPLLHAALEDIRGRGRRPIVCGGTALYLMGFLRGFGELPGARPSVRERLIAEAREQGTESLHRRLAAVDPKAAATFLPGDLRRIVRALEVHEVTGRPMSERWSWSTAEPRPDVLLYGIQWEREALYARTDRRVAAMVERGLFEEALELSAREPPPGRTALQCIGYKEVLEGRQAGWSRAEVIERIRRNTRRLVKRQMTWFRKLPVRWLSAGEPFDPGRLAREILDELAGGASDRRHLS